MKPINWKDLFFPMIIDIEEVNKETNSNKIAENNLELSKNSEKYIEFLKRINHNNSHKETEDSVIVTQ